MGKNDIWYGYLMAGDKSTPVVRDPSVAARSDKFIRLFNYSRGEFVDYSREIVGPKLRDLNGQVSMDDLKAAFLDARQNVTAPPKTMNLEKLPPLIKSPETDDLPGDEFSPELDEDFDEGEIIK